MSPQPKLYLRSKHLRWAVEVLGHEGLRAGVEVVDEDHGVVGEGLGREDLREGQYLYDVCNGRGEEGSVDSSISSVS